MNGFNIKSNFGDRGEALLCCQGRAGRAENFTHLPRNGIAPAKCISKALGTSANKPALKRLPPNSMRYPPTSFLARVLLVASFFYPSLAGCSYGETIYALTASLNSHFLLRIEGEKPLKLQEFGGACVYGNGDSRIAVIEAARDSEGKTGSFLHIFDFTSGSRLSKEFIALSVPTFLSGPEKTIVFDDARGAIYFISLEERGDDKLYRLNKYSLASKTLAPIKIPKLLDRRIISTPQGLLLYNRSGDFASLLSTVDGGWSEIIPEGLTSLATSHQSASNYVYLRSIGLVRWTSDGDFERVTDSALTRLSRIVPSTLNDRIAEIVPINLGGKQLALIATSDKTSGRTLISSLDNYDILGFKGGDPVRVPFDTHRIASTKLGDVLYIVNERESELWTFEPAALTFNPLVQLPKEWSHLGYEARVICK